MASEIVSGEFDITNSQFFGGCATPGKSALLLLDGFLVYVEKVKKRTGVKSGLKGGETVVFQHV